MSKDKINVVFSIACDDKTHILDVSKPTDSLCAEDKCRQIRREILQSIPDSYHEHLSWISENDIVLEEIDKKKYLDYRFGPLNTTLVYSYCTDLVFLPLITTGDPSSLC